MKAACGTITAMARTLGRHFDKMAGTLMPSLLGLTFVTIGVISKSGNDCIHALIQYTRFPMDRILEAMNNGKNDALRVAAMGHILSILDKWPKEEMEGHLLKIEDAVVRISNDANSDARGLGRAGLLKVSTLFPSRMEELCSFIGKSTKAVFIKDFPDSEMAKYIQTNKASKMHRSLSSANKEDLRKKTPMRSQPSQPKEHNFGFKTPETQHQMSNSKDQKDQYAKLFEWQLKKHGANVSADMKSKNPAAREKLRQRQSGMVSPTLRMMMKQDKEQSLKKSLACQEMAKEDARITNRENGKKDACVLSNDENNKPVVQKELNTVALARQYIQEEVEKDMSRRVVKKPATPEPKLTLVTPPRLPSKPVPGSETIRKVTKKLESVSIAQTSPHNLMEDFNNSEAVLQDNPLPAIYAKKAKKSSLSSKLRYFMFIAVFVACIYYGTMLSDLPMVLTNYTTTPPSLQVIEPTQELLELEEQILEKARVRARQMEEQMRLQMSMRQEEILALEQQELAMKDRIASKEKELETLETEEEQVKRLKTEYDAQVASLLEAKELHENALKKIQEKELEAVQTSIADTPQLQKHSLIEEIEPVNKAISSEEFTNLNPIEELIQENKHIDDSEPFVSTDKLQEIEIGQQNSDGGVVQLQAPTTIDTSMDTTSMDNDATLEVYDVSSAIIEPKIEKPVENVHDATFINQERNVKNDDLSTDTYTMHQENVSNMPQDPETLDHTKTTVTESSSPSAVPNTDSVSEAFTYIAFSFFIIGAAAVASVLFRSSSDTQGKWDMEVVATPATFDVAEPLEGSEQFDDTSKSPGWSPLPTHGFIGWVSQYRTTKFCVYEF